jgi:DNA-binding NarL/FixJ family response regulator
LARISCLRLNLLYTFRWISLAWPQQHNSDQFCRRGNILVAGIRTVIVTMSPLLTDIIEQLLSGRVTLEVIGRFDVRTLLEEKLRVLAPDLILVGLRRGETDEIGRTLLSLVPVAKVIAFTNDARHGYVHEMRAHRAALIDISPQALIKAIHTLI